MPAVRSDPSDLAAGMGGSRYDLAMKPQYWVRAAANLTNLSTPLGLLVGLIGGCRFRSGGKGLILAESYRLGFPVASAFTMGNVVLICRDDLPGLERHLPDALHHEDAHSWQYAYCLGLPFLPAYAVAMGWSWLRTGNRSAANHFEVQAGLRTGGYREAPPRPVREGFRELAGLVAALICGGGGRSGQPGAGHAGGAAV